MRVYVSAKLLLLDFYKSGKMFSSDKNIENIGQLFVELKRYVDLKSESLQVDFVSKFARLLSALVVCVVLFILFSLTLMFVSMMVAAALTPLVGSEALAYAIVILLYIIIGVVFYGKRAQWVEGPITNFLVHLFLEDKLKNKASGKTAQK